MKSCPVVLKYNFFWMEKTRRLSIGGHFQNEGHSHLVPARQERPIFKGQERKKGSRLAPLELGMGVTSRLVCGSSLPQTIGYKDVVLVGTENETQLGTAVTFLLRVRSQIKCKTTSLPTQLSLAPWRIQSQAQKREENKTVNS